MKSSQLILVASRLLLFLTYFIQTLFLLLLFQLPHVVIEVGLGFSVLSTILIALLMKLNFRVANDQLEVSVLNLIVSLFIALGLVISVVVLVIPFVDMM